MTKHSTAQHSMCVYMCVCVCVYKWKVKVLVAQS